MIFVAGVPKDLFTGLAGKLTKVLPDGSKLVDGRAADNNKRFGIESAKSFIKMISERAQENPKEFVGGLSVSIVHSPNEDFEAFANAFLPFSLVSSLLFERLFAYPRGKGPEVQNELARALEPLLKSQLDIRRQVGNYLTTRLPRTPFVLPEKAFGEAKLVDCVSALCAALPGAGANDGVRRLFIEKEADFEEVFPYPKPEGPAAYENTKGVRFKSPGRDLHGIAWKVADGHHHSCFLNAKFRFGGPIKEGFHYDCTRGAKGKLAGGFDDCHGGGKKSWSGNPHLNIFPNDFIRSVV